MFAREYQTIQVPLETIDHFCEQRGIEKIDYLKIDTEGAELRVLQGAERMLREHKITALQFEYGEAYYDANTTLKQTVQLLSHAGFVVFRISPYGLELISPWKDSVEDYNYSNFFAILHSEAPKCKILDNL